MKYILIEYNDGQAATLTICDGSEERDALTVAAIYGERLNQLSPEQRREAQSDLQELRERGELNFEGDPGLRWIEALEVKCPNTLLSDRSGAGSLEQMVGVSGPNRPKAQ